MVIQEHTGGVVITINSQGLVQSRVSLNNVDLSQLSAIYLELEMAQNNILSELKRTREKRG